MPNRRPIKNYTEWVQLILPEIRFVAIRSRGPGGQNVNKVSSAAMLIWDFTKSRYLSLEEKNKIQHQLEPYLNADGFLFCRSDEFRDLERNKSSCLKKLSRILEKCFFVAKPRKPTKISYSKKLKRQDSKRRHSEKKSLRKNEY